ncbi:MAG: AbiV family abortive infection protein [Candidatus Ranarchaeia archaeon]
MEDERIYLNAYHAFLENAESFLEDATLLAEKKSFGHAYALVTIGIEELAKAFLFLLFYFGFAEYSAELVQLTYEHKFKLFMQNILSIAETLFKGKDQKPS